MNFSPDDCLAWLAGLETAENAPLRYIVAYSGGLDSTVLLHLLAENRGRHGKALLAVHVDHGLQASASAWAQHCKRTAAGLDVDIQIATADIDSESGRGPEAAARTARYAVFRDHVTANDWLLSAHHRDDQAETLLLNLLRGSGPAGVAGIPVFRKFAGGWLARPLLGVSREALRSYATARKLAWIDDPSNDALQYDRNFLRSTVLPLLETRWGNVSSRLGKSAGLAREASMLLDELADSDLAFPGDRIDRLDLEALRRLSPERQRNALRRAINRAGLPPVPATRLKSIIKDVLPARDDARPVVKWNGAEVRRYRNHLYVFATGSELDFSGVSLGTQAVGLGAGMGYLVLEPGAGPGFSMDCVRAGLTLRVRTGGEEIRPIGQAHTRTLKNLLQEAGVVPWMRDRLPLVYRGERLVAVGDLWMDADSVVNDGLVLRWHDRPALY